MDVTLEKSWNFTTDTVGKMGYFFYFVNPADHMHEKLTDVRNYYRETTIAFFLTIVFEQVIRLLQKKTICRYNDTISNVAQGVLMEVVKIPLHGVEVWAYAWIYNNYRLIELPWESPWTWLLCMIFTDFSYYWMHRLVHQVNIFWAFHEAHHTHEDMNLTAPMRNNIFLIPIHWITYLPMALGIPPTTYLVHHQLNMLYNYWLHTETIDKLHPAIEFIFGTPSHHRAHHGRNRRYIDKNFGSFLIIWDRIFGTFEKEIEEPLYGTTKQMRSFNPLIIQTNAFRQIWKNVWEYKTIEHKLSAVFKGPGWAPGKPWVGNLEDIPEPTPVYEKYHPELPAWCVMYVKLHFAIFTHAYMSFALNMWFLSSATVLAVSLFLSLTAISFGFMLDRSSYASSLEFFRCLVYFLVDIIVTPELQVYGLYPAVITWVNRILFSGSIILWINVFSLEQLRGIWKEKSL